MFEYSVVKLAVQLFPNVVFGFRHGPAKVPVLWLALCVSVHPWGGLGPRAWSLGPGACSVTALCHIHPALFKFVNSYQAQNYWYYSTGPPEGAWSIICPVSEYVCLEMAVVLAKII
jgi:hypothetical protein